MFLQCTYIMKQEKSAWIHNTFYRLHEQFIVISSNMFKHSDTDNSVKLKSRFRQISVIHQTNFQLIFQMIFLNPLLKFLLLFFT